MSSSDTIAAIATAPGRGGVAVVRVSGPEAPAIAARLTGSPVDRGVAVRRIGADKTGFIDEAVVLSFRAPHSYTGEDVVEFQCHGGTVTPRRVLEACFAAGARLARRGEFTERAFLNGRLSYDQAESVLDLIDAKTVRAADAALRGLAGSKQRELQSLYDAALDLSTRLEYALDVDEGELPDGFEADVASGVSRLASGISGALRRLNEGRLLRNGALVVIAGPPNAGKSSLMNALLETDRAIVSDVPGTTRDSIEEGLDIDGWPIRLVDTAGLRETSDGIEAEGVRRAGELIARADVIVDLGSGTDDVRAIRVHAKCDLGRGEGLNVSSKTGEGLGELRRAIVARLEEKVSDVDSSEATFDTSPLLDSLAVLSRLTAASGATTPDIVAQAVRSVAGKIGSLVGATYTSDLLDNLFSRFCVGK